MARKQQITNEEKQILKDYSRVWRELIEAAERDMRICQRDEITLRDCEFETIKTGQHTSMHIMRHGGEIIEVRSISIMSGTWAISTASEAKAHLSESLENYL